MRLKWFAFSALAVTVSVAGISTLAAHAASPQAPMYGQGGPGWDAPPPEFREIQRKGFHDGIEGARKDFDNHRRPNVNNRDEYRHPHVDPAMREDYREGFRRGYDTAMRHLMNEPPR